MALLFSIAITLGLHCTINEIPFFQNDKIDKKSNLDFLYKNKLVYIFKHILK